MVDFFSTAAEEGHGGAAYELALLHAGGGGCCARDLEAAARWAAAADAVNHPGARELMQEIQSCADEVYASIFLTSFLILLSCTPCFCIP